MFVNELEGLSAFVSLLMSMISDLSKGKMNDDDKPVEELLPYAGSMIEIKGTDKRSKPFGKFSIRYTQSLASSKPKDYEGINLSTQCIELKSIIIDKGANKIEFSWKPPVFADDSQQPEQMFSFIVDSRNRSRYNQNVKLGAKKEYFLTFTPV